MVTKAFWLVTREIFLTDLNFLHLATLVSVVGSWALTKQHESYIVSVVGCVDRRTPERSCTPFVTAPNVYCTHPHLIEINNLLLALKDSQSKSFKKNVVKIQSAIEGWRATVDERTTTSYQQDHVLPIIPVSCLNLRRAFELIQHQIFFTVFVSHRLGNSEETAKASGRWEENTHPYQDNGFHGFTHLRALCSFTGSTGLIGSTDAD